MDVAVAGTAAVWAALVAAVAAVVLGVAGRPGAGRSLGASCGLAAAATGALTWALLTGDLRLAYVADTTRRTSGWADRLAGLWGGMSGSLLLWTSLLLVAAVAGRAAVRRSRSDLLPVTTASAALVAAGFLAVVATVADPFALLAIPAIEGVGLAPVLERPAMRYHPPLLYAGLVSMVVPFAVAVAGMVGGTTDRRWLALVRRSTGVAWVLLTLGLLAGAHWAYGELGWGGFWAWDPIENAGLLPWLAATVVLHAVLVDEHRRPLAARWSTAVLATTPLLLAVVAAVLTRSGAASSVHAFAESRSVGHALLAVLGAAVAGGGRRCGRVAAAAGCHTTAVDGPAVALAANGALLAGVGLVVAAGTLYPLAAGLVGEPVVVAGSYFARFTGPLAVVGIVLLGVGPQLRWSGGARPALRRRAPAALLAAGAVALASAGGAGSAHPFAASIFALGAGAAVLLLADGWARARAQAWRGRRALGAVVAHLGMVGLLVGVAGATLATETTVLLGAGEEVEVAGHVLRGGGVVVTEAAGTRSVAIDLELRRGSRSLATLRPGQTAFLAQGLFRADPALRSTPAVDVQVVLRRLDASGVALVDVGVRPLVQWVWWGSVAVAVGGALSTTGGPRPGRAARPAGPPAEAGAGDRDGAPAGAR